LVTNSWHKAAQIGDIWRVHIQIVAGCVPQRILWSSLLSQHTQQSFRSLLVIQALTNCGLDLEWFLVASYSKLKVAPLWWESSIGAHLGLEVLLRKKSHNIHFCSVPPVVVKLHGKGSTAEIRQWKFCDTGAGCSVTLGLTYTPKARKK
jgi:hypothetical protein